MMATASDKNLQGSWTNRIRNTLHRTQEGKQVSFIYRGEPSNVKNYKSILLDA